MTGSQEAGRSNPLAGRVSIHREPEYQGVRFVFGNQTERPIGVAFSQPIPDSTALGQFRFHPERYGDSWTLSETELSFAVEVDGQSTVETGYAVTDTDVSTVWNAINQGTVTVSDADGEVLGQVGGLEPNVVDPETEQTADDSSSDTAPVEDETDETRAESSTDSTSVTDQGGDDAGSVADVDATDVADLAAELDAETASAEADTSAGGDSEPGRTEPSGGETEENRQAVESRGATGDEKTADLPATRADYILGDVRGEIQSASEFEWRTLGERSTPRRLVDRVRSWLGF